MYASAHVIAVIGLCISLVFNLIGMPINGISYISEDIPKPFVLPLMWN
jgi:hypothetical protein